MTCVSLSQRLSLNLLHEFTVEKVPMKRKFLEDQFSPKYSFADVNEIAHHSAVDCLSNTRVVVPWVHFFWAGFSCKSRSRANSQSVRHMNCLQRHDDSAETSYTFDGIMGYVSRVKPRCVILENVIGLQQASPGQQSDADFVLDTLHDSGYVAKLFRFDSADTGSRATRVRLYFVAWLVDGNSKVMKNSIGHEQSMNDLEFLMEILSATVVGSRPSSDFLSYDLNVVGEHYGLLLDTETSEPVQKTTKVEWQNEHLDFFREHGLEWPVDLAKAESDSSDFIFVRRGLSDRAAELLWFCHKAFKRDETLTPEEAEYMDTNPPAKRLLQGGGSPWKTHCPTMIGSSHFCIRYIDGNGRTVLRPISPLESFALVGWDSKVFRHPILVTPACMHNMAGNAFSGFAFVPVLAMAMTGCGIVGTYSFKFRKSLLEESESGSVASDCDTDSQIVG